jgi:molybdopterin/thiamine biosynthesis adenylyltransferase
VTREEVVMWLDQAVASGLLQSPGMVCVEDSGQIRVATSVAVLGDSVGVFITMGANFPVNLPLVQLREPNALGYLPHVLPSNGVVCFSDSEGLLLNRQRPDAVLTWSVEHTRDVLAGGLSEEAAAEFMRELEVYWGYLSGDAVYNFMDPPVAVSSAVVFGMGKARLLAREAEQIPRAFRPQSGASVTQHMATYLPLPTGTTFTPPHPDGPFWTIDQLRALVEPALAGLGPKRRRQLFKKTGCWQGLLVLAVPLAEQHRYSLIGIDYTSPNGFHPFDGRGTNFELRPVQLPRWERTYLVPRGGGQVDLMSKRVLLVGCGAIGGHLAHELVRAGVQWLTLVDHDTLSMENMHRHALGMAGEGKHKVFALRDDLQQKYLYAEIKAVNKTLEQALAAGDILLDSFDLVIAATGVATLELFLNEQARAQPNAPPALYTWLEPYGLGGHALLTRSGRPGCLQCLYTSDDPAAPLANRALFAAPGQRFSIALSGCSSLHTPYASFDASETATLAARLAVQALTGREKNSPLWSWKGDKREFKAAGFKTGARYKLTDEALRKEATSYINPYCPVCGSDATSTNA